MACWLAKSGSSVLLIAGLAALCSCGRQGSTLDPGNRILGTWVSEDGLKITVSGQSKPAREGHFKTGHLR